MIGSLLKNSAIYGLAPFLPKILTLLLLPILTQYLTSADYGIIGTVTSIVGGIQVFSQLGLQVVLPNYFYKCPCQYKVAWREIYGFLSVWMIVFAFIQALLLYFTIPEEASENKWWIIFLSNFSSVFFGPTSLIGSLYYQLNIKPVPVAARLVISGVVTILCNYVCVVWLRWGYMGSYIGSFAGTFLVNMSYWPVVNKKLGLSPIYNFKWKSIRRYLNISIPTIPHYYTQYLLDSTNTVALNFYEKPQSEIGQLSISQTISSTISGIIQAVNQVVYPMSLKYIKEKDVIGLRNLSAFYITITWTCTFFYSLWSREAFDLLIRNEELNSAYLYSIFLVMGLNYRPMYVICSNYFFFHEKTKSLLTISFLSGLIAASMYFVLVPFFGVLGAVVGYYVACLVYGYIGYFFKVYKQNKLFDINTLFYFITQNILLAIAIICVDCSILVKIVMTLFFTVFVCSYLYFKIKNRL